MIYCRGFKPPLMTTYLQQPHSLSGTASSPKAKQCTCTILQYLSESSLADWSRAMVYESIDHGNDVTCHAVPVVLILVFSKNKIMLLQKTNRPQFSMVYTLIDYRNDSIKCSKLCSEATCLQLVVPFEFCTFYYIISMVYKCVHQIVVDLLTWC